MSDAEVRVLEAQFNAKIEVLEKDMDRVLKMVDVNGGSVIARIGFMEKNWESRLVAEAEARLRDREDHAAVPAAAPSPEINRKQVAWGAGGATTFFAIVEGLRFVFFS